MTVVVSKHIVCVAIINQAHVVKTTSQSFFNVEQVGPWMRTEPDSSSAKAGRNQGFSTTGQLLPEKFTDERKSASAIPLLAIFCSSVNTIERVMNDPARHSTHMLDSFMTLQNKDETTGNCKHTLNVSAFTKGSDFVRMSPTRSRCHPNIFTIMKRAHGLPFSRAQKA